MLFRLIVVVISIFILAGCAVAKDSKEFSANIATQQERLAELEAENESISQQFIPRKQVLQYLQSTNGKKYYKAGACRRIEPVVVPHIPRPKDSCKDEYEEARQVGGSCDIDQKCMFVSAMVGLDQLPKKIGYLTNLGCAIDGNDESFIENSAQVISDTFCDIGLGSGKSNNKKKGNREIKPKGKFGIIYGATRGLACYNKFQKFRNEVDTLSKCINEQASSCRNNYSSWLTSTSNRKREIAVAANKIETEFEDCKIKTRYMSDNELSSEQQLVNELDALTSKQKLVRRNISTVENSIKQLSKEQEAYKAELRQRQLDRETEENEVRDL